MPAYPSHNILLVSAIEEENGVQDDISDSGTLHSRILYSGVYRFTIRHYLTLAEWQTYRDTYQANKRTDFTGLTFYDESPARTYTVKYTAPPQVVDQLTGGKFIVEAQLRGTAD